MKILSSFTGNEEYIHDARVPLQSTGLRPHAPGPTGQALILSLSSLLLHMEQHCENAVYRTLSCDLNSKLTLSCLLHTMGMGASGPRTTQRAK